MSTGRKILLSTCAAVVVATTAWFVTWGVVYGDNLRSTQLAVQFAPNEQLRTIELRLAPKLPESRGHDYVTLDGVIRTRLAHAVDSPLVHLRALQHESWHVKQQSRWPYWGMWLTWYGVSSDYRTQQEAEAKVHEGMAYPHITLIPAPRGSRVH